MKQLKPLEMKLLEEASRLCGWPWDWQQERLGLAGLMAPEKLGGLQELVERLAHHLERKNPLVVVGDYDADGIFSTVLMVEALRALGAQKLTWLIPDRWEDGYGLSTSLLEKIPEGCSPPGAILTVDNGIRACEAVEQAQRTGWEVLITDHHLPGPLLPQATACVNPKVYAPELELAGVGVAFFVALGLFRRLQAQGCPLENVDPRDWLSWVTLGTLADMVPLDFQNRLLVRYGLARLKMGRVSPGLQALLGVLGYGPGKKPNRLLTVRDLTFRLIPMVNAAGRLDQTHWAVEGLLAQEPQEARRAAQALAGLNEQRKQMQVRLRHEAEAQALGSAQEASTPLRVFAAPHWPLGLLGLLASQLKGPGCSGVFVFSHDRQGRWRGSGRSAPVIHLGEALAWIDRFDPGLLSAFGGHRQAAGLGLSDGNPESLERFKKACLAYWLSLPSNPENLMAAEEGSGLQVPLAGELLTPRTLQLLDHWLCGQFEAGNRWFKGGFEVQKALPMRQGSGYRLQVLPLGTTQFQPLEGLWFGAGNPPCAGAQVELHYQLRFGWGPDYPLKLHIAHWRSTS